MSLHIKYRYCTWNKGLLWFHQVALFLIAVGRGLIRAYWCSVFILYMCRQAVAMCADRICQLRPTTSSGYFGTENLEDWCLIHRSWHHLVRNCILPIDSYCTEYPSCSKLQQNKDDSLCYVTLSLNLFNPGMCKSQPLIPSVLPSSVHHPVWVHFGVI